MKGLGYAEIHQESSERLEQLLKSAENFCNLFCNKILLINMLNRYSEVV